MTQTLSPRAELAYRLADFIDENHLAQVFGGRQDVAKSGRYYSVMLSVCRTLDGFIRVYGPKFILIQLQGQLAPHGQFQGVFESEANALEFLRELLVNYNQEAAMAVPRKEQS